MVAFLRKHVCTLVLHSYLRLATLTYAPRSQVQISLQRTIGQVISRVPGRGLAGGVSISDTDHRWLTLPAGGAKPPGTYVPIAAWEAALPSTGGTRRSGENRSGGV